jgi:(1->4)-alpha-D-glucan 1-alpha-D-glucosylmutase
MDHEKPFDDIYGRFIKSRIDYQDLIYEKKKLIMQTSMPSEINMLGVTLNRISEKDRHTRDFTLNSLTTAMIEVIANFPVYRTYITQAGMNERDQRYIEQAVSRAKRRNRALSATVFDFLQDVLFLRYPGHFNERDKMEWLNFVMRFQQMTGPIMAKGVEDTAFYVYNRFVSLNEVGGYPERFGTSLETFHGMNIERKKFWPYAMITTMTHDTKRSEDVRGRLDVLSEIPDEWRECLNRWSRMNKKMKAVIDGQWIPDRNEEYLLYQTLIGIWPIHPMNEGEEEVFKQRIREYMLKAVREAKVNTSWISPNLIYEEHLLKFIDGVLSRSRNNPFLRDLEMFHSKISYCGMFTSLSQTLLKITSPGIPDLYQGTELWDFSLVDPDNRRPVNFDLRKESLTALKKKIESPGADLKELAKGLIQEWKDGTPKLYVIFKALNYRKRNPLLFRDGNYIPLETVGNLREHVCAFARQRNEEIVLVIVPRFLVPLVERDAEGPLNRETWGDTRIVIPEEIPGSRFTNIFTGETIEKTERDGQMALSLGHVLENFPVAMVEKV